MDQKTGRYYMAVWSGAAIVSCLVLLAGIFVTKYQSESGKVGPKDPLSSKIPERHRSGTTRHSSTITSSLPSIPLSHPEVVRRDQADEDIVRIGGEAAMDKLSADTVLDRDQKLADAEALVARWAERNPAAAWKHISAKLAPGEDHEDRDLGLWQAAVSGYIEGIVETDPEGAVAATRYLQPGNTPELGNGEPSLVAAPSIPGSPVGLDAPPRGSEPGLAEAKQGFVWERGWVPPVEPPPDEN